MAPSQSQDQQSPWLQPLATWVSELDADSLPERVISRIADCAIDWWGAVAAGCNHTLAETYRKALAVSLSSTGPQASGCSVAGWSGRYPLERAAATNAAISHLAEVDDGHKLAAMHPGVTVFPGVLALAEEFNFELADIQAAIVAGYEVGLKVGSLLGKDHYSVCHTTATAGSFGAAAAASRLLRLSPSQTLAAFGHAGTQAAGLWQLLDDKAEEAKAFHPAAATRNGLTAVNLARNGLAAGTRILEGPRGMLKAWGLQGDASVLTTPNTDCYQIETTTIKGWPVCGQMHSSLDALNDLLPQIENINQVNAIRVDVCRAQLDIANFQNPQSYEETKFSSRFCLAFLLYNRRLDFENFSEDVMQAEPVLNFMDKIHLEEKTDFTARFPKERPARVEVTLKNGQVLHCERRFRRGDPEQPWQWNDLVNRFITLTPDLDSSAREKLIEWSASCGRPGSSAGNLQELFACLNLT